MAVSNLEEFVQSLTEQISDLVGTEYITGLTRYLADALDMDCVFIG